MVRDAHLLGYARDDKKERGNNTVEEEKTKPSIDDKYPPLSTVIFLHHLSRKTGTDLLLVNKTTRSKLREYKSVPIFCLQLSGTKKAR